MSVYTRASDWCDVISGIHYITKRPLIWEVGMKGSYLNFVVDVGTKFDVSIPPGMRWIFNPHDPRYLKAACLHDEMLRRGWSRLTAGAEFHEALKADGVALWRRLAMWLGVSLWKYE